MPAPTPTGEKKLTSLSMIPGDSYNTSKSGSICCSSSQIIHVQSESGHPLQRTKKHRIPPSLIETICSSKMASIRSLNAHVTFWGARIRKPHGINFGLEIILWDKRA